MYEGTHTRFDHTPSLICVCSKESIYLILIESVCTIYMCLELQQIFTHLLYIIRTNTHVYYIVEINE